MGWYKIGNRILSEEEMYAQSGKFLDLAVPSVMTGIWVWILTKWFSAIDFFAVHTTTTKLIYVISGLVVFMLSYAYRKLIVALGVIAFVGMILLLSGFAFFEWVIK